MYDSKSCKLRILFTSATMHVWYLLITAVGEPPQAMSNAVLFAVKRAIEGARHDAGDDDTILLCKHNIGIFFFHRQADLSVNYYCPCCLCCSCPSHSRKHSVVMPDRHFTDDILTNDAMPIIFK